MAIAQLCCMCMCITMKQALSLVCSMKFIQITFENLVSAPKKTLHHHHYKDQCIVLSDNNMKSTNTLWAHDRLFGKAGSICSSRYGLKGYIHKMCLYVLEYLIIVDIICFWTLCGNLHVAVDHMLCFVNIMIDFL